MSKFQPIMRIGSLLVCWVGCSHQPAAQPRVATPEEERRLYPQLYFTMGQQEPGAGCTFLGIVSSSEGNDQDPYKALREQAIALGGNYLVPDPSRPSHLTWTYHVAYEARGRAYRCSAMPVAPARVAVNSQPTQQPASTQLPPCEPECSPGYTCLRGTCVSACNPPCANGERCGADRTCHPVGPE
jgi:hypothetical protein